MNRPIWTLVSAVVALGALSGGSSATTSQEPAATDGRIAFVTNDTTGLTDVASIRPSGTGKRSLTSSKANELYVDVSPDGSRVAFTRFTGRGGEIFVVPIKGGTATRLTNDDVHDELPVWSPDSSRIAFVRYPEGDDPEIFVMDADGSDMTRVTENADFDADPRWSPDGTQLIFNHGNFDEATQDVYLVTLGVVGETTLTQDGVNDTFAEWAPTGDSVVYSSYRNDQWDLYSVDVNTMVSTQLTDDPNDDYAPRWSPDGSRFLYINGRLEGVLPKDRVMVMSPGADPVAVTPGRLNAFSASWSPSGEAIVFVGEAGETKGWELFRVAADGSDRVRLTRTPANEFDPAWAPR